MIFATDFPADIKDADEEEEELSRTLETANYVDILQTSGPLTMEDLVLVNHSRFFSRLPRKVFPKLCYITPGLNWDSRDAVSEPHDLTGS